jgi:hypothetical protein
MKPEGGWEHIDLADKVELFWVSRLEPELPNSLWAIDGQGIKVFFFMPVVVEIASSF